MQISRINSFRKSRRIHVDLLALRVQKYVFFYFKKKKLTIYFTLEEIVLFLIKLVSNI